MLRHDHNPLPSINPKSKYNSPQPASTKKFQLKQPSIVQNMHFSNKNPFPYYDRRQNDLVADSSQQFIRKLEGQSQNPKPKQNLGRQFEKMKNQRKDDLQKIKKSLET